MHSKTCKLSTIVATRIEIDKPRTHVQGAVQAWSDVCTDWEADLRTLGEL